MSTENDTPKALTHAERVERAISFVESSGVSGESAVALARAYAASLSEWIPVKDETPRQEGQYQAVLVDGEDRRICQLHWLRSGRWACFGVTHWRELGELPEAE